VEFGRRACPQICRELAEFWISPLPARSGKTVHLIRQSGLRRRTAGGLFGVGLARHAFVLVDVPFKVGADENRERGWMKNATWIAFCVLVSLFYLSGEIAKSVLAALFVFTSLSLGLGGRRLPQLGLAISITALAVAFGCPTPTHWPALLLETIKQLASVVSTGPRA
jgi:hypothetical protein